MQIGSQSFIYDLAKCHINCVAEAELIGDVIAYFTANATRKRSIQVGILSKTHNPKAKMRKIWTLQSNPSLIILWCPTWKGRKKKRHVNSELPQLPNVGVPHSVEISQFFYPSDFCEINFRAQLERGTICQFLTHFTMLQKVSKCEVKAWLCWNLIILPRLTAWNHILVDSNCLKMLFLAILEVLNFDF